MLGNPVFRREAIRIQITSVVPQGFVSRSSTAVHQNSVVLVQSGNDDERSHPVNSMKNDPGQ